MIARLQQAICFALLAVPALWLWLLWEQSVLVAAVGAAALLGSYPVLLACEFWLLCLSPRDGAVAPPSAKQLLQAWAGEVRHGSAVFFWRQPFRANAIADDLSAGPGRGVVFLHGLFCNRGFWTPWMREARARGFPFLAIDLEPISGSIDSYVPLVDAAVRRMAASTGRPPVLICHSMGGLAARAWLAAHEDGIHRICRIVTIGTPHAGTWMARLGHGANARQMRRGSPWLDALSRRETAAQKALFTCWCSNSDNVVFPHATAALAGADNRWVPGIAHVALAFDPDVMEQSLALAMSPDAESKRDLVPPMESQR